MPDAKWLNPEPERGEPPLCERCGERHYGRTHPFRTLKHKSAAASHSNAKGAGQTIPCVNCDGKGYTLQGWGQRYPVECGGCHGSGIQTIRKRLW